MSIIFNLDQNGKVIFFPYGITNGDRTEPCANEEYANNKLKRKPYSEGGWSVIISDDVPEELAKAIEGKRFDDHTSANTFINEEGYLQSPEIKIAILEVENASLREQLTVSQEINDQQDLMIIEIFESFENLM